MVPLDSAWGDEATLAWPQRQRRARVRKLLTDEQSWVIVSVDPSVPDRQLADRLGVPVSTVHAARWRFRRQGWTCAVRYTVCLHCGDPLTRRGRHHSRREYHDACRQEARRSIQRAIDRRRWKRMPVEARNVVLDRAHEHEAERQAASQASAVQHKARWTEDEDAVLIERAGEPLHILARELGRTLWAILARRWKLRRQGVLE